MKEITLQELKCTGMITDREKSPLMKELHELGLKHGVVMVVLAVPIVVDLDHVADTFLIDHRDDTHPVEAADAFVRAGIQLIHNGEAIINWYKAEHPEEFKHEEVDPDDL